MVYKYHSCFVFFSIKQNHEGKYIHNEIFNNIPYFDKTRLHVNCLKDGFFMYNDKVLTRKIDVINHISHSVIPMY